MQQATIVDTLDIRIGRGRDLGYYVELRLGDREFPDGALDPALVAAVAEASPDEAGARLFAGFTADERVRMAWNLAAALAPRRRIRLRIDDDAPGLHALPWEALRDASPGASEREPAADRDTPFSRLVPWSLALPPAVDERPLRILSAVAAPGDLDVYRLPPIDREAEAHALAGVMALAPAGLVHHDALPGPCTLAALEAALERGYHVLHLVAHGVARRDGQLAIFLERDDGSVDRVDDSSFAAMLERLGSGLRLVVLMVCSSALRSPGDASVGLAPRVLAAGVPAVLAMQDLMPVDTGRAFTRALYSELWSTGEVDRAANRARATLLTSRLRGSAVPVLYSALASNQLFTRDPAAQSPIAQSTAQSPIAQSPIAQSTAQSPIAQSPIAQSPIAQSPIAQPRPAPPAIQTASPWQAIGGPFREVTAIRGRDGCVELFALASNKTLHVRRQQQPGGPWGPWEPPEPLVASVHVTLDARGQVALFALDPGGQVWIRRRVAAGEWARWVRFGTDAAQLTAACHATGQLMALIVGRDGLMYTCTEDHPGGPWGEWAGDWENDDETHLQIALVRDARGRFTVFSLHADHTLWGSHEAEDDFGEWEQIGEELHRFTVAADLQGRLFLAGIAQDRSLRTRTQRSVGGPWTPWRHHELDLLDVHVAPLRDTIVVHTIDGDGAAHWLGPDTWAPLGGPACTSILALEGRKGELIRLALDHAGTLHERRDLL
ncbi:MAG: CHAT domain-containing protein [Nannocystis sp.]|nr:CHAT domain-containing protein [Nannocystis sp.]